MAAIIAHVQRQPTPPSASSELDIPKELDQIVLDCLAKEPAARPANAEALSARLDAVPCASSWTEQNAARWWETHRPSTTPGGISGAVADGGVGASHAEVTTRLESKRNVGV
jgi:hypothetical protein